jgi:hypothetical protein
VYYDETTGRKCAIGCLIDQIEYPKASKYEGDIQDLLNVAELDGDLPLPREILDADRYFLRNLQRIHDDYAEGKEGDWSTYLDRELLKSFPTYQYIPRTAKYMEYKKLLDLRGVNDE